jgi:hypothetical protein
MTPRRSVYGDQGQEVAWEVGQEQFVARQEDREDQEIAWQVGVGSGCVELAQRVVGTLGVGRARWTFDEHEPWREQRLLDS